MPVRSHASAMFVERLPIARLKPCRRNARTHSRKQIEFGEKPRKQRPTPVKVHQEMQL